MLAAIEGLFTSAVCVFGLVSRPPCDAKDADWLGWLFRARTRLAPLVSDLVAKYVREASGEAAVPSGTGGTPAPQREEVKLRWPSFPGSLSLF